MLFMIWHIRWSAPRTRKKGASIGAMYINKKLLPLVTINCDKYNEWEYHPTFSIQFYDKIDFPKESHPVWNGAHTHTYIQHEIHKRFTSCRNIKSIDTRRYWVSCLEFQISFLVDNSGSCRYWISAHVLMDWSVTVPERWRLNRAFAMNILNLSWRSNVFFVRSQL